VRDVLIGLLVFGSIPFCFWRPDIGILVYIWIGLMNPHRLSWRIENAPVGLLAALATLGGIVFRGEFRRIPMKATTILLVVWFLYTTFTTLTALSPREAWIEWNRFSRILLMCFVAMMLLQTRERLERYVWVAMGSIAFFSVKGGLFSIATRGAYRVWGPMGSFIEGNNELALAEIMILPLMLYFLRQTRKRWLRLVYYASFVLTVFSILFSYSRGAFVAFAGVAFVLMIRSRYRLQAFLTVVLLGGLLVAFVPAEWKARMFSIGEYKTDQSAMGRINAWHFAANLAKDRPFGGGFRTFTKELFQVYAPNPADVHDAHSIYFEVLAEQGYFGLAIFLGIHLLTLWKLEKLRKFRPRDPALRWARELAEMLQFSLLGYLFGGAFLGLAYFDLPYYLVVTTILLEYIAHRQPVAAKVPAPEVAPPRTLGPAPATSG